MLLMILAVNSWDTVLKLKVSMSIEGDSSSGMLKSSSYSFSLGFGANSMNWLASVYSDYFYL